jgi:hypothetical protein
MTRSSRARSSPRRHPGWCAFGLPLYGTSEPLAECAPVKNAGKLPHDFKVSGKRTAEAIHETDAERAAVIFYGATVLVIALPFH